MYLICFFLWENALTALTWFFLLMVFNPSNNGKRAPPSLFPLKPWRENKGTQRYISFHPPLKLTETSPQAPQGCPEGIPAVAGFIATQGKERRGKRPGEMGQKFGPVASPLWGLFWIANWCELPVGWHYFLTEHSFCYRTWAYTLALI